MIISLSASVFSLSLTLVLQSSCHKQRMVVVLGGCHWENCKRMKMLHSRFRLFESQRRSDGGGVEERGGGGGLSEPGRL